MFISGFFPHNDTVDSHPGLTAINVFEVENMMMEKLADIMQTCCFVLTK